MPDVYLVRYVAIPVLIVLLSFDGLICERWLSYGQWSSRNQLSYGGEKLI